jgi:hypothetical protein
LWKEIVAMMKRRKHPRRPAPPPKPKQVSDLERNERHLGADGTTVSYRTSIARVDSQPDPRWAKLPYTPPPDGPREYYLVRFVHEDPGGDEVCGGEHHNRLASPAVVAKLLAELRKYPQNTKITVYRVTETWERMEFS